MLVEAGELLDLQGGQDFAHCSRIAYSSAAAIAARCSLLNVFIASRARGRTKEKPRARCVGLTLTALYNGQLYRLGRSRNL